MIRVRVKACICVAIAIQFLWLLWGVGDGVRYGVVDSDWFGRGGHDGQGKKAENANAVHVGEEQGAGSDRKQEESGTKASLPVGGVYVPSTTYSATGNGEGAHKTAFLDVSTSLTTAPARPEETAQPEQKPGGEKTANNRNETSVEKSKPETLLYQWNVLYDQKTELSDLIYGNTLERLENTTVSAPYLKVSNTKLEYTTKKPYVFNPYPAYNSEDWKSKNEGEYQACEGPDGALQDILVFPNSKNIIEPSMGSYPELGISGELCFERQTRLGPYGFLERHLLPFPNGTEGANRAVYKRKEFDWHAVDWGDLQGSCVRKNAARLKEAAEGPDLVRGVKREEKKEMEKQNAEKAPRTAVLLRSWAARNYTENDKQNIRSLITELSLQSGGEYQVFLLLQLKGRGLQMPFANATFLNDTTWKNVPNEFRNITVLWSENQIGEWYPQSPKTVRNAHRSQLFPLQVFAQQHPEFEYFWNWEMDVRYTGHHYDLLEKIASFARAQPRKYLWERNERYYISSFHGSYSEQFRETVANISGNQTVWGPVKIEGIEPSGPIPPVTDAADDDYEWGVGEEADYISVAPMFDPVGTKWFMTDEVWGFQGKEHTPRRTVIGTHSRLSQKLLKAMHLESLKGNHVANEMGGPTTALLHGLKAVYAPVPIFFDRLWEGAELDKFFNPGPKGVSGSHPDSPFSVEQESRFRGSTWYSLATPPQRLYNHWLGWEDGGIGGVKWEKQHGRMCLPAAFLHPVRHSNGTMPG